MTIFALQFRDRQLRTWRESERSRLAEWGYTWPDNILEVDHAFNAGFQLGLEFEDADLRRDLLAARQESQIAQELLKKAGEDSKELQEKLADLEQRRVKAHEHTAKILAHADDRLNKIRAVVYGEGDAELKIQLLKDDFDVLPF